MSDDKKLIQRTNLWKGEFSPSGVETARCLRKFYYTKMLGLKPKTTPAALIFGICVHAGVEKFYQMMAKIEGVPGHEEALGIKIAVVKEFTNQWVHYNIGGDLKRNLDSGIMIMSNYCDKYIRDGSRFTMEDIESDQWVAMPNSTMMLVKMDRVLNQDDLIILVDTKTTSGSISDYYFRNFENHLPTSLYMYTVRQLLGRCDFVMIDAIKVPPPKAGSKSEPFGRATFLRTELQINDAIASYSMVTNYIMSVLKKPESEWAERMVCNHGECNNYGGCPFLSLCKHGLDHPTVRVNFDIEEPKGKGEML